MQQTVVHFHQGMGINDVRHRLDLHITSIVLLNNNNNNAVVFTVFIT